MIRYPWWCRESLLSLSIYVLVIMGDTLKNYETLKTELNSGLKLYG